MPARSPYAPRPGAILAASGACGGIGRRARLRALWTVGSVEVRVLSGAFQRAPLSGALLCSDVEARLRQRTRRAVGNHLRSGRCREEARQAGKAPRVKAWLPARTTFQIETSRADEIAGLAIVARSGRVSRHGEPPTSSTRRESDMRNLTLVHAKPDPVSFCIHHMPPMTRSTRTPASVRFCMNATASPSAESGRRADDREVHRSRLREIADGAGAVRWNPYVEPSPCWGHDDWCCGKGRAPQSPSSRPTFTFRRSPAMSTSAKRLSSSTISMI
jgi:hypothetical protein